MPASRPGCFVVDVERVRAIEPALFDPDHRRPDVVHLREQMPQTLMSGDTQPALVISTAPTIVASYSDELDGVVLLRLPDVADARMPIGHRTVTVNSYGERSALIAKDIVFGPRDLGQWGNVMPLVAALFTNQPRLLARRVRQIRAEEWTRLDEALARHREKLPHVAPRDARPTKSWQPTKT